MSTATGGQQQGEPLKEEPIVITPEMLVDSGKAKAVSIEFERGMSTTPAITLGIIALNICFFVPLLTAKNDNEVVKFIERTALIRKHVLEGQVWRMISCLFVHGGVEHLLGNMAALYIVGMACEHAFGPWQTVLIFLGTGVFASITSLLAQPGPSVGASGAVFGVLGCALAFFFRHRKLVYLRDKRIGLALFVWAIYSIILGLAEPMIDNAAHIGGLISGLIIGYVLWPRLIPKAIVSKRV